MNLRLMRLNNLSNELVSKLTNIKMNHLNKKKPTDSSDAKKKNEMELKSTGLDLFENFFEIGCEASKQNIKSFKNLNQIELNEEQKLSIKKACELIADTENWLYRFLLFYPGSCIQVDEYEIYDKDICQIRSGMQFMFDLFKGVDEKMDKTLDYFIEEELLNDIDSKIKIAKEFNRIRVKSVDKPNTIPASHDWWIV